MIGTINDDRVSVLPTEYLCEHCSYGPDPCERGEVQITSVMDPHVGLLLPREHAIVECDAFKSKDGIEKVAVKVGEGDFAF